MAKKRTGHRPIRVAEKIKARLGTLLMEGLVKDPRVQTSGLVSITDVRMTPDLKRAYVYVSVFGGESDPDDIVAGLQAGSAALKSALSTQLELRYTPHLEFRRDDSIAYGAHIEGVLKEVQAEDQALAQQRGDEGPDDGGDDEPDGDA